MGQNGHAMPCCGTERNFSAVFLDGQLAGEDDPFQGGPNDAFKVEPMVIVDKVQRYCRGAEETTQRMRAGCAGSTRGRCQNVYERDRRCDYMSM